MPPVYHILSYYFVFVSVLFIRLFGDIPRTAQY